MNENGWVFVRNRERERDKQRDREREIIRHLKQNITYYVRFI